MAGGTHYYTLESNPEFAAVLMSLVDLAGLKSFVTVLVGDASQSLHRLHATAALSSIDFLFLDHDKDAYLKDLKLCEGLGLLDNSTIVAANGIQGHGAEPYDQYIKGTVESKWDTIRFEQWQQNWYGGNNGKLRAGSTTLLNPFESADKVQHTAVEKNYRDGNPNLTYESKTVKCNGPTGITVSALSQEWKRMNAWLMPSRMAWRFLGARVNNRCQLLNL